MKEVSLGMGNNIYIKPSQVVTLYETLTLIDKYETITLDVKIEADFSKIPEKYHEVMVNTMTSKYYNKVSYGDNPFSKCTPPAKKRWWEIWK